MAASIPKKIALILSSTRPIRVGPSIIEIIQKLLEASPSYSSTELTVVDVANYNLPIFNEKVAPAMVPKYGQFEHEHSKIWSAAIAPYDGYIWVTPEYNFGTPGGVKNAIDYLYNEWIRKPILILAYGIQGGKSASESLKRTLEGMKLRVVKTRPLLTFAGEGYSADVQAAMGGQLGEESKKKWAENKEIGKAFEELVELINDPEKKGSEGDSA